MCENVKVTLVVDRGVLANRDAVGQSHGIPIGLEYSFSSISAKNTKNQLM